jgi:hypothetical protein
MQNAECRMKKNKRIKPGSLFIFLHSAFLILHSTECPRIDLRRTT